MPIACVLDPTDHATDSPAHNAASAARCEAMATPLGSAEPGDTPAPRWRLSPNHSLSPRALLASLGLLAGVSLAISLVFLARGAPFVLPFACLETLCLLVAVLLYAARAGEDEEVWLQDGQLWVRRTTRHQVHQQHFPVAWVQVRCDRSTGDLIELACAGQRVRVGRHVALYRRQRLAHDMVEKIRGALQAAA